MSKICNQESYQFYLNLAGRYPLLSKEEEYELAIRKENGDEEARQKLICSNLRLIINLANSYNCDIDVLDLISAGQYGLTHAVDKYQPSAGTRLSTYATPWIKKYQFQEIEKNNKRTNTKIYNYLEDGSVEEVRTKILSLDNMVNEDSETSLIDMISDDTNLNDSIYNEELEKECKEALYKLTEQEQIILYHRLGLYDYEELSVKELSERLSLTPSKVNTIFKQAKAKLAASMSLNQTYNDFQNSFHY